MTCQLKSANYVTKKSAHTIYVRPNESQQPCPNIKPTPLCSESGSRNSPIFFDDLLTVLSSFVTENEVVIQLLDVGTYGQEESVYTWSHPRKISIMGQGGLGDGVYILGAHVFSCEYVTLSYITFLKNVMDSPSITKPFVMDSPSITKPLVNVLKTNLETRLYFVTTIIKLFQDDVPQYYLGWSISCQQFFADYFTPSDI
jgi:hypothetical protein